MDFKVLIDTNVLIDFLARREPYYESARSIFECCKSGKLSGCLAAHSITNAFFILRKAYTIEERCQMLLEMSYLLDIVPINFENIIESLQSYPDFSDIEDCLQVKCAQSIGADLIVTRNLKHFSNSMIPVITPDEFMQRIEALC